MIGNDAIRMPEKVNVLVVAIAHGITGITHVGDRRELSERLLRLIVDLSPSSKSKSWRHDYELLQELRMNVARTLELESAERQKIYEYLTI